MSSDDGEDVLGLEAPAPKRAKRRPQRAAEGHSRVDGSVRAKDHSAAEKKHMLPPDVEEMSLAHSLFGDLEADEIPGLSQTMYSHSRRSIEAVGDASYGEGELAGSEEDEAEDEEEGGIGSVVVDEVEFFADNVGDGSEDKHRSDISGSEGDYDPDELRRNRALSELLDEDDEAEARDSRADDDSDVDGQDERDLSELPRAERLAAVGILPAWQDSDDEKQIVSLASEPRLRKLRRYDGEDNVSGTEYSERLRAQYARLHPMHDDSWADIDPAMPNPVEELSLGAGGLNGLLQSAGGNLFGRKTALPQGNLDLLRLRDANVHGSSDSVVQSARFHPSSRVLLTAGLDKTLRLFEVDGEVNARIASVHVPDLPISQADFSPDGRQAFLSGRRKFFYVYDTQAGHLEKVSGIMGRSDRSLERFVISPDGDIIAFLGADGHSLFVSTKSKQLIGSVRMNAGVRSACFSPDGREFLTAGLGSEIFRWDVGTRKCMHRFVDEGALHCTALAYSPDGQYIATGSNSGVVNVYDAVGLRARQPRSPSPVKSLMHLVDPIADLRFNPRSEMLSFSSRHTRESLKLAHIPSFTVFPNWPTSKTPLGYVSSVDFSPNTGFMAVGNDKGRVLLYRLNHYGEY